MNQPGDLMKNLLISLSAATLFTATMFSTLQAEPLNYEYQYTGSANLSGMTAGSLRIGEFTDARDGTQDDTLIIDGEAMTVEGGLAGLLESAMTAALEAAQTPMSPEAGIAFNAEVLEFSSNRTEQGLTLTLRCNVEVEQQGRNLWESVLFSQATSESGSTDEALDGLLDRLTQELFRDDYFRMALGIF